ncbi:MAG: LptF/LptG family permease [Gemmatimonadetes bacterium]|nr:LptF/LptG family permease [Gemmatimonadota bacterium]
MRLKIVTRYILKEHLGPLVFSLSALTSLLLLNYVAKRLGELVGKGLPPRVIAEFLLLSVPFTVAMTLPMAVLVSTLHAFSRMASENEITAFKASGISLRRLIVPVIVSASILTLVMVWFNDQVLPAANHRLSTLSNDIARKKPTFALKEQIINEVVPGRLYLRTAHLTRIGSRMKDVTLFDMADPQHRRTIRADSGLLELTTDGRDLLMTLFSGNVIELTATDPSRLQRNFFTTDRFRVRGIGNSLERDSVGGEKSDREMTVCELERKVHRAQFVRDSNFTALKTLDPVLYKSLPQRPVKEGIGNAYCRALYWWTDLRLVKRAQAETLPQGGAAQASTRADAKLPVPPQAPPKTAAAAQGAVPAQAPPAQAPPAQAPIAHPVVPPATIPPSAGLEPGPDGAINVAQRSVLGESVRISIEQAQAMIDGNQVEIEKKFAIAAACVIFVLLGAPIALRFPRGGVGLTIGVRLGVFGIYYVGLIAGEDLARRGMLSAFWAMWTANIILFVVGAALTARLGHEGTTSRGSETSEWWRRLMDRLGRGEGAT